MWVRRIGDVRAHAARCVARVATLRGMTRQAARWLRARFDRVANHEVPTVHLSRLDLFRPSLLDREILRHVVTRLALRLRMAALAKLSLLALGHHTAVVTKKRGIVLEEPRPSWNGS